MGAGRGKALPGRRRHDRQLAGHPRPGPRRRADRRAPVVGALLQGARLPGPQRRALPLVQRRRGGGPAAAGRRGSDSGGSAGGVHQRRQVLLAPTAARLAAVVGLNVDPRTDFYDLIVIGGGPAGLGAAVYGASEGLRTVLIEKRATGGQAGQSSRIENYLGFSPRGTRAPL